MDIYETVTQSVITRLEQGVKPWTQPWSGGAGALRPLRHNGQPYRGINVLILWGQSIDAGYRAPYWMTYKQAQALGGQVKKGEHATHVVYYGSMEKEDDESAHDEDETKKRVRFLRTYCVFNVEQIEGLLGDYYVQPDPVSIAERLPAMEAFAHGTGADIREGGGRAFYRSSGDFIQMPPIGAFRDAEQFYATLNHELTHWTKHPSRLDRDMGRKQWGDEGYAAEELVAELGSAFLGAELGLRPDHLDDHAAYIAEWLKVLKNDRRFIFIAAAKAQAAADYLMALQQGVIAQDKAKAAGGRP